MSSVEDVILICNTSGTGYTQLSCGMTPTQTSDPGSSVAEAKLTQEVEQRLIDKRSKRQRQRQNVYESNSQMVNNRMAAINGSAELDDAIVSNLLTMLDHCNVLVQSFRMVRDRVKENELLAVQLIIKSSRSGDGRLQNMPTVSEIAGLIVGNIDETIAVRDIIVYDRKMGLSRISDLHPSFMAMQYPLLFPYGEDGFRLGVPLEGESKNSNKKRKDVTMMEYAAFRIQQRCDEGHTLILSGKLFQTYIVDMFTCIEEDRLLWVRLNQTKLRAELYCGIKDAIFRGDTDGAQVGKRIILPSSFTGGSRYMTQNYQDAIALCRVLGNPDLFITITSNPKWQEIKYALDELGGQRPDERPDIVARVFKIKLDLLMEDLQAGQYFGNSIAAVYTIEFQKRGLPHAHILLWLDPNSKYPDSDAINKIISAEIPDRETDPVGYAAVGQYMMHGPCGIFNTSSPCMRKGNCSKHFPKKYVNETVIDESGFAVYRRRNDNNRWVDKNGTKLDNAYVVPYNRNLIVKYQSHINVEWCNRGRSIKYLFKYITKGPDHASISLRSHKSSSSGSNNHEKTDEIQYYLDCRYISAPEAIWRIYGFYIHYRIPTVERLPFHLPDQQSMIFKDSDDLNEIIDNIHAKKSKFISWMEANKLYDESKTLTYSEFPSHFVWLANEKRWKIREKGRSIGRVVYSHPTAGERFYLRLLLNVVKGPTSFDDIKTKDGIVYPTFKEACQAWRLLNNDQEWQYVLDEASYVASGKQFRQLFAKLLLFCEVVNPQILWENNWKYMAEGILEDQRNILDMPTLTMSEQELQSYTLAEIQYLLLENGRSLKNFKGMPLPDLQIMQQCKHKIISEELNFIRGELRCENEKFIQGMNTDQKVIYDTILGSVYKEQGGLFFIYGHGGTGKTYLWKSIISKLRSEGKIVLPVASSGIASILLPKGRTAHSRFNIPIILKNNSTCGIKIGSPEAELIKMTSLIIWDEAPMVHKHAFEAVDRTFKDILGAECSENVNKPFGGKTFVLGGDFRQILPVIPKGSKHDILHASISCSYLWRDCKVLTLTKNMRLQTQVNESTTMSTSDFSKWVLDIGNGDNMCKKNAFHDQDFLVEIPDNFIIHANGNPIDAVISSTYPRLMQNYSNEEYLEERAILTARNEVVDIINNEILDIVPGDYTSIKDLDLTTKDQVIKARVTRLWENINPISKQVYGLQLILIDENDNDVQGNIKATEISRFRPMIEEGRIHILSKFKVITAGEECTVTLWNKIALDLEDQTQQYDPNNMVMIITGIFVTNFRGNNTVSSSSASRVYINIDDPKVKDLSQRYE
ncbi:uncharacterized protein LOC109847832 [Asparagus officinalis]|uniref:uncharacterized protein LOC109847832 n=1 Tax=Asparagus officinalis TaxID=4686 RepID=UPI00098DF1CB|nr:uncharacterized protein LOC109847832 [Asparagus officinalis]